MKHYTRRRERGVALVAAVGFMIVILGIGLATTMMATREQVATRSGGDKIVLRNLAEAGVDRALNKMNQAPLWRCEGAPADFSNQPLTEVVGGVNTTLGTYTVDPVVNLGGDYVQVTSHGYYPSATAIGGRQHRVRVIAYKKWGTPFSAAAFGRVGVPLANGDTDSYNSGKGSYGGQPHGTEGDIRTDSTDPSAITIFNNGHCNGKVIYGPGTRLGDITLSRDRINDGDGDESNDVLAAPANATAPDMAVPSDAIAISSINHGINSINTSMTITAGTYWCDSINLTGKSTVVTTGQVILYVTGSMNIGGNGILNNNDIIGGNAVPSNLILYGTPTCTSVSISGNGALSAAVYAPNADIVLNGAGTSGVVYGALAGRTVSFNGNGTVLHYDEALQCLKGVVMGFRPKSWEED